MTKQTATQKTAARVSYEERASKKEDIRRRLQALKDQNGAVSSNAFNKKAVAHEAAMALQRFQSNIKNENERTGHNKDLMDPWQKENYRKLESAAEASEEAAADAVKRKEALNREINELSNELENFGYLLGVDEVLRYQEDIAKAEKKVTEFQALIAAQEDIIEKARQAAPDSFDALLQKREDVLADIFMDKATDKDLKALDEKIAAQDEAVIKFNKTASQANQVIAGLQRKLSAAEDELSLLQSRRQDVFTEFLMGRAEILGKEYVDISMQLIDKFKQLVALDQIMGYPSRLIGPHSDGFSIPTFRLKVFDGLEGGGYYGQIHAARLVAGPYKDTTVIRAAVDEMTAQISAAGVDL